MANQYKKLQKKLYEKNKPDDKKKEPKVGKDYPILILIGLTIFVCFLGWGNFDNMNRAMYVLLTVSLILTYVRRHAKLSETRAIYVERASAASIGLAYIVGCIIHYIALRVLGWLYDVTHIGWLVDYYHRNTAAVVIAVAGVLWIWFG